MGLLLTRAEVSGGKGTGQEKGGADLGAAHRPAVCVKGSVSLPAGTPSSGVLWERALRGDEGEKGLDIC